MGENAIVKDSICTGLLYVNLTGHLSGKRSHFI